MRPRPLFVLGSKRSGSTVTVDLLNTHPRVFVSHESDVLWILYQARAGQPARYVHHPLDSDLMMTSTVRTCGRILRRRLGDAPTRDALVDAFYDVQTRLLAQHTAANTGLRWRLRPRRILKQVGKRPTPARLWRALRQQPAEVVKRDLAWIGDKKHAQHADPEVHAFCRAHFPDARYLHVVRHPRGVLASTQAAAKQWRVAPEYFDGGAAQIVEQWAAQEEWVLQAKAAGAPIHTVRLEDLSDDPIATMERVFAFLELEMPERVRARIPEFVYRDPNAKYRDVGIPEVPRARRVMDLYGFA